VTQRRTADAFAADDRSGPRNIGGRLEEPPIEALVVTLGVVVMSENSILPHGGLGRGLAEAQVQI
jgi:hypothetical protein